MDDMGCSYYFNISELLNMPIERDKISKRACEMLDNKELYFDAVNNVPDENQIAVVHMGLTVTECCSLKCRDCSFLMQYYQHPQNIDLGRYKYAVDRFLDIVDRVSEIRPIGGEPFVNPYMYKVLEWYHDNRKIGSLDVYTNGTIVPSDRTIEALKYKKVRVHISDYGAVNQEKLEKVVERLTKEGIKFNIRKYDVWQNGGDLRKRNFSKEQMEDVFSKCFMTNCYSFLKTRFYGCPRAAHGMNMGAIPDMPYDYVDFGDEGIPDDVLKQQLISLMRERRFLGTCDYCDGLDNHVEGIVPAIQVERALMFG